MSKPNAPRGRPSTLPQFMPPLFIWTQFDECVAAFEQRVSTLAQRLVPAGQPLAFRLGRLCAAAAPASARSVNEMRHAIHPRKML